MEFNMKKIFLALSLCFSLAACGGSSLLGQNSSSSAFVADDSSLLAQVSLHSTAEGGEFEIPDYRVHLHQAGMVIGNLEWLQEAVPVSAIRAHHEGENHGSGGESGGEAAEHEEPTGCDYEGRLGAAVYVDLTQSADLPCVKLPKGAYTGIQFSFIDPETASVLGLPEGAHGSIHLEGEATHLGTHTVYPFHMHAEIQEDLRLDQALDLDAESHHLEVHVDVMAWFHGFKFDQLEQSDGVILLDEEHNMHRFEHMLEHMRKSFSLGE